MLIFLGSHKFQLELTILFTRVHNTVWWLINVKANGLNYY